MNKFSMYLATSFLGLMIIAFIMEYVPKYLLFLYLGISAITFIVYAIDKSRAKRGAWRTAETTLHLLAFIGGWPGAAIAQQTLRHKSQKKSFRIVFWLTVIINIAVLVWFISTS